MKYLFTLLIISALPLKASALLYATLDGYENDIRPNGQKLHVIVAGYGGSMGNLTYEMAVSKAKKLKQNFPSDRVLILGSTSYEQGHLNKPDSPEQLERSYDIDVNDAYQMGGQQNISTKPLLSDSFSENILLAISDPQSLRSFLQDNPSPSFEQLSSALKTGEIKQSGSIGSIDFMTHSSPLSGIHLHNDTTYYRKLGASEARGLSPDGINIIRGKDGNLYRQSLIKASQRALSADSDNIEALNGFFSEDAYVNMAGCSGGYGVATKLSRSLGVPVMASANGAEVYVMDEDGKFYYDYSQSNPHESVPLTRSEHAALGHVLGANASTPPMALRPGLRMYRGYWGNMLSGTNFTITTCNVRPGHDDDMKRCEMGMARKIEDSITETSAYMGSDQTKKFKAFLARMKENMCPNGYGIDSDYEQVAKNCSRAIDLLAPLSINCNLPASKLNNIANVSEIADEIPSKHKAACTRLAKEYIESYRDFVPMLDENGKTLVCDFSGCRVQLKNCEVTNNERKDCLSKQVSAVNEHPYYSKGQVANHFAKPQCYQTKNGPYACMLQAFCPNCSVNQKDEFQSSHTYKAYKSCLKTKRCEIDEEHTVASNHNNFTFMNYIQHYINGYMHLMQYRKGNLQLSSDRPVSPNKLRQQRASSKRQSEPTTSIGTGGLY